MSNLTIICPNAKRVQVKTTPMMLMRQVLEEACLKSGFDVNCHQLQTQSKKSVDLSLPFRLTGFANNASFDMIPKKAVDANASVELAFQHPSGSRQQANVRIASTLLDVLKIFGPLFNEDLTTVVDSHVPCLVYMNKQYTGESELVANTLYGLGIASGRCLIRFVRVKMSNEQVARMIDMQREEEERKTVMDAKFAKMKAANDERERMEKERELAFEREAEERARREEEQLKALLPTSSTEMDTTEFVNPLQRDILQDVPQQNPNDWSFDGSAFSHSHPQQNTMRLEELNRLLERVDSSLASSTSDSHRMDAMVDVLAERGRISLSQIQARADESLTERSSEQVEESFAEACDRQAVFYHKHSKTSSSDEPMEIGEEFFQVQVEDIKAMQKDLRKMVNEQSKFVSKTFVAKKNRELKMAAYMHCVVRITIGEHILQACFNSGEPSTRLNEFLTSVLNDKTNFTLSFTNQRIETDSKKNFVDLELAPRSNIVARFGGDRVIASELLKNVRETEVGDADAISVNWLTTNTVFKPFSVAVSDDRIPKRPQQFEHERHGSGSAHTGPPAKSALPKWFSGRK